MEIKQVEELTGLMRPSIRFYEREGLIDPPRQGNGYRDYSEADVDTLLRVKLLRGLHIPLEEIKLLQAGERQLSETLVQQIATLEQEQRDAGYARDICRAMREDSPSYATLDARKYLERAAAEAASVWGGYLHTPDDAPPATPMPGRRFFARSLDLSLYSLICWLMVGLVFKVNLTGISGGGSLAMGILAMLLMLLIEPLLLSRWGTTPGKAILGLYVENEQGGRISYNDGLERTINALLWGMGFNIPIFNIVRLVMSANACSDGRPLAWDAYGHICYTGDSKKWRIPAYLGAYALIFFVLITAAFSQLLPPNRGELTVAQFVENHNYYADYFDVSFGDFYLAEDGHWAETPATGYVVVIGSNGPPPDYDYQLENGVLSKVSLDVKHIGKDDWIFPNTNRMMIAALAIGAASPQVGLYSNPLREVAAKIEPNPFSGFSFSALGYDFAASCQYSGYDDFGSIALIPQDWAEQLYYHLQFSVSKSE